MQHFFLSLNVIEQQTASLNLTQTMICPVCCQSDQWISHGYLYKKSGQTVGKRILCSRRYGKSGCGHTQSLYVDDVIPQRRYTLSVLLAFVNTLVEGNTVEHAYYQAIGHTHSSPRQAWRWLNSLWANMSRFRLWPVCSSFTESIMQSRSRRLTLLLNTLHPYLTRLPQPQRIQHDMQCRFC